MPGRAASLAKSRLAAVADSTLALSGLKVFKPGDDVCLYGVKSSGVRSVEKEVFRAVRGELGLTDAVAFCEMMVLDKHLEAKGVGCLLLGRFQRDFDKGLLQTV